MKVIFIDDEFQTELANTFFLFQEYYGVDNIIPFEKSENALQFLDENSESIDIAFIDQIIAGSSLDGLEVGRRIANSYPYISSVMLTGGSANLETCQRAMRIGFCDFLDKASDISPEDVLYETLNYLETLPSIKAKQDLKKRLFDSEFHIKQLSKEIRNSQKEYFLKEFDENDLDPKIRKGILQRLDAQEDILSFAEHHNDLRINRSNLAAGIYLLMGSKGKPKKPQDLKNDLKNLYYPENYLLDIYKSHKWYSIKNGKKVPKRLDSNISGFFKLRTDDGKKSNVLTLLKYEIKALTVMALLQKHTNRWETTIKLAQKYTGQKGEFFTFIDEIVKDMFRK